MSSLDAVAAGTSAQSHCRLYCQNAHVVPLTMNSNARSALPMIGERALVLRGPRLVPGDQLGPPLQRLDLHVVQRGAALRGADAW